MAEIYHELGDHNKAQAALTRASELDPDIPAQPVVRQPNAKVKPKHRPRIIERSQHSALDIKGDMMDSFDKNKLLEIDEKVKQAISLKRRGEIKKARQLLESCLKQYKDDHPVLLAPTYKTLAKVLYIQEEYPQAERCYVEAIRRYQIADFQQQVTECLIHLGCCSQEFLDSQLFDAYVLGLRGRGVSPQLTEPKILNALTTIGTARFQEISQQTAQASARKKNQKQQTPDSEVTEYANFVFYGKQLTFRRDEMSIAPGKIPPMITTVETLVLPCLLGRFDESCGEVINCSRGLEILLSDLAPSAFICPYCFSLMFIDSATNAGRYNFADLAWAPNDTWTLYGYATYPYPVSGDVRDLHWKIKNLTSGSAVLVATRTTDELEQAFGLPKGKYVVSPAGITQQDLDSFVAKPSDIASFIIQEAMKARQNHRHQEALGLVQRALAIYPESEEGRSLLRQYS
jgi:tetratricopeptide (TPR) repeat protein